MVTLVMLFLPLTAPQVDAGTLSVIVNVSSHSVILSLIMFIANDFDVSSAATLTVVAIT